MHAPRRRSSTCFRAAWAETALLPTNPRAAPAPCRHCNYFPEGPVAFTNDQLRRLAAPTLLVAAQRDSFGPGAATAERARAVWPSSQLDVELLPGRHVGNRATMERTSQRVIRFFEERGLAGAA